ncbi:peptidylprolyl isomerase [Sulfurimonas sp.]|jgi:FKBP-type peptidyl-prolyl cis-trans isomerase SlyD|uniref:FKBP-type peptidyl-prolyl cis-trans isomerase n=1 Tax=Sulfurimonas sp. TaxID=2022749 RepID=UPI0025EA42A2|nr:peptidylprolyl isomerase [Sulfurimonas sp.]MCK9472163.1 peptidylprolyl isomerase [Sulfurimonas sp.]MDD3506515.1 peptidylprolyl isomerase [Sulfurimonas sp.]
MAISNNQVVSMEYEVKVNGNVVDSNVNEEPLEFTFGCGQIISGLESRIANLSAGESASILVPASEAYGEYNEEAMQKIPKEQFEGIELSIGLPLQGQGPDGNPIQVIVKDILDDEVLIDFNHPLAGEELSFNVNIISVK